MDVFDYLESIPASGDTPLFFAYGRRDPDDELELIGNIYSTTSMFRSSYGDLHYFFKHNRFGGATDILSERGETERATEWLNYVRGISNTNRNNRFDDWDDTPINEMPYDPQSVIEDGVFGILVGDEGQTGCPFAWLLNSSF